MRSAGGLACLALAGIACATTVEIAGYDSDCYEIAAGSVNFNPEGQTWSLSGICARKKNSQCPDITLFQFEGGPDANGNGTLEPEERAVNVHDVNGGDGYCVGTVSGSTNGATTFIYHYEVWKEGQTDAPVISKSEVVYSGKKP